MCIGILKEANKKIDKQTLLNCYTSNDDGAGVAVIEKDENGNDELNIYKGIFSFDKLWEIYEKFQDKKLLIHCRIATHKYINGENCHPWRVNDDLVFIHNGTISSMNKNLEISDTGNFANEILRPLAKIDPDFWQREEWKWFIENAIGSGNKLVLMNTKGEHVIFNESAGIWDEGVWYSNTSFRRSQKWTHQQQNPYDGVNIMDGGDDEGEFSHVSSAAPNSTSRDTESDTESSTPPKEETLTYDLDEIDKMLEQENSKIKVTA